MNESMASSMNDSGGEKPSSAEAYWFESPKALFCAPDHNRQRRSREAAGLDAHGKSSLNVGDRLRNAFWPDSSLGITHAANVNRLTRVAIIVAVILAIVFRSWWPVAIAAGIMFLVMIIAYGLQVARSRQARERRSREYAYDGDNRNYDNEKTPLKTSDALSSSIVGEMPSSTFASPEASLFLPPDFPPTISQQQYRQGTAASLTRPLVDWGSSSYVPNEQNPVCNMPMSESELNGSSHAAVGCDGYPQCGPGGPVACGSSCTDDGLRGNAVSVRDPRADIPNPSRHNTYDRVDARYRLYETKAQPVMAVDTGSLLKVQEQPPRSQSAPPIAVGIDPKTASLAQMTPNYQRPQTLSSSYMGGMATSGSAPRSSTGASQSQPRTQTERMLNKMYQDKNSYFWDEMVAKRAPTWRQNPNDPRNRLALQQKELERQSYRGLSWGSGP